MTAYEMEGITRSQGTWTFLETVLQFGKSEEHDCQEISSFVNLRKSW